MKLDSKFTFEIPYNFDPNYITILTDLCKLNTVPIQERIEFVYVACYEEDCKCTRKDNVICQLFTPHTRDEYTMHIRNLQAFGLPVAILFQYLTHDIDLKTLRYYTDELDISIFIVANDTLAKKIKEIKPSAKIIASIVKKLLPEQIKKDTKLSIYSQIVLDFPFQRGLNQVKSLPKTYEYSMLVNNNQCLLDCNQTHHWRTGECTCEWYQKKKLGLDKRCNLNFEDMNQFVHFIKSLKIQGRDASTFYIAEILHLLLEEDDQLTGHDENWLNYSEELGLFQINRYIHPDKIHQVEVTPIKDLIHFHFEKGSPNYTWLEGKTYQLIIDEQIGVLRLQTETETMIQYFPLTSDCLLLLHDIFHTVLIAPDQNHFYESHITETTDKNNKIQEESNE